MKPIKEIAASISKTFTRSEWAIFTSAAVLGIVLLLAYQIKLHARASEILIELRLDPEIEEEKEKEKEKEEVKEIPKEIPQEKPKTYQAYNAAMQNQRKATPKQTTETKNEAPNEEKTQELEGIASDFQLKLRAMQDAQSQVDANNLEMPEGVNNFKKDTRIWYSLLGRTHRKIAVPIFMCDTGGKVGVKIYVSPSGSVVEAAIDEKSTSTNNGCLLEAALKYAQKTTFMPGKNGYQWGTIYYLFYSR